jgi:predicted ATP-dependent serine protease
MGSQKKYQLKRRQEEMNRNLTNAATKSAQMKSLLVAMENSMMKIEVLSDSLSDMDTAMNLLYLAEEVMTELSDDIEKIQGDEKVVDVIRTLKK